MTQLLDALWRAAAYCLHGRVILWSVLPLVLMVALTLALGKLFWESAMDAVAGALDSWHLMHAAQDWLVSVGLSGLKSALPPFLVLVVAIPVIVVLALLAVATMMTPAMVNLVAARRFPTLERRRGGTFLSSVLMGVGTTVVALVATFATMPLWLIPPLVLVLPPVIWGWLAYRVMSYDVLADHASRDERRQLIRRHRPFLLGMGVVTGFLGAAPSLVWSSMLMFVVAAPVLIPVAVWIYTLVFAFSALWFAHYGLAALQALRAEQAAADSTPSVPAVTLPPLLPPL